MSETTQHVDRRLDAIGHKLDSIDKWRISVDTRLNKHDETLFGNGKPGMDEMIRQMYEWMTEQKAKQARAMNEATKFALGTLAFILNTLIAIWISKAIP